MTEPAIAIDLLSLSVRGKAILQGVSARMDTGQFWSIIGPNGAGKSTLLKCLLRIHAGWTGAVRFFGKDAASYSQRELARCLAYVPQQGEDQLFSYTVREFVRMGRYPFAGPFGAGHEDDEAVVEAAMERVGVLEFSSRRMEGLSGGERQKAYIAAALVQEAPVLLLDEPTAFLDYHHQKEVFDLLQALQREQRATVVSVTHDVNAAMLAGGMALALREGQVVYGGRASGLADTALLRRIYGARFRLIDDAETGLQFVAPQGGDKGNALS